jgi:hypothetical protein
MNKGNAYIIFYSSNGALLKSVKLGNTGKGTINIKANELPSQGYISMRCLSTVKLLIINR